MAQVNRTTIWQTNNKLKAADLDNEFNNLLNALTLVDADIAANADISISKINTGVVGGVVGTTDTQVLTNKDLTSVTNTFPTSLATLTGTQVLANKTLTKPTVNGSIQAVSTYSPGAGGTATLDLSNANLHFITMPAGNITIVLSNASVGQCFVIRILQDSGGSRTVTWFSTIHWAGGSAPTLTTSGLHWDTLGFICTATNVFDGYTIGANLS